MQSSSHRKFNIAIAIDFLIYHPINWGSFIIPAIGIVVASSIPDIIERIGLRHRGISHSLILYGLIGYLLMCYINKYSYMRIECLFLLGMIIGCLGHIIADMFSHNGIKVLGMPVKFNLYTTGNRSEYIFLWLCIAINFIILLLLL